MIGVFFITTLPTTEPSIVILPLLPTVNSISLVFFIYPLGADSSINLYLPAGKCNFLGVVVLVHESELPSKSFVKLLSVRLTIFNFAPASSLVDVILCFDISILVGLFFITTVSTFDVPTITLPSSSIVNSILLVTAT